MIKVDRAIELSHYKFVQIICEPRRWLQQIQVSLMDLSIRGDRNRKKDNISKSSLVFL